MNNYVFFGLMLALVLANFAVGGNIWTASFIILSAALSQHDARLDCQNQVDRLVEKLKELYANKKQ